MNFADLGLADPVIKALDAEGYNNPTPIQAQAIPPVLAGRDLLGIAQTGTGKTAAFALPILTRLAAEPKPLQRRGCRALIVTPTRELAAQIGQSFNTYGQFMGVTVAVVFGGVGIRPQVTALTRGADVLVATPGRLLDHVGERTIALSGTEILVLDEVDQMLDLGFIKPIKRIVAQLSAKRQNLFFSATMPKEISGLADELLNDPVKVSVAPAATTAERVEQRVIHIEAGAKRTLLAQLCAGPEMARTLVFTRTKRGADRVARHLAVESIPAFAIHGNKSQRQREDALHAFRKGRIRVLVATDIAARGIDIDGISHVVNFELPDVPEAYVHRIGRTARAGASGKAISLCAPDERDKLRAIERLIRQSIPSEDRRGQIAITATRHDDDRRSSDTDRQRSHGGRRPENGEGRRRFEGHEGRRERTPNDKRRERENEPRREHRGDGDFRRPNRDGERRYETRDGSRGPRREGGERRGDSRGENRAEGGERRRDSRGESRAPSGERRQQNRGDYRTSNGELRPDSRGENRTPSGDRRQDNRGDYRAARGHDRTGQTGERRPDVERRHYARDDNRGRAGGAGGVGRDDHRPGKRFDDRGPGKPRRQRQEGEGHARPEPRNGARFGGPEGKPGFHSRKENTNGAGRSENSGEARPKRWRDRSGPASQSSGRFRGGSDARSGKPGGERRDGPASEKRRENGHRPPRKDGAPPHKRSGFKKPQGQRRGGDTSRPPAAPR